METWLVTLKKLLGIPEEDTSQDEAIMFFAMICLEAVQTRTGRAFLPGIYLDTLPGPHRKVYTNERPIIEVLEVNAAGAVLDESEYRVDLAKGIIYMAASCRCASWFTDDCCYLPLAVKYQANNEEFPAWLSLAVSDAIRAAMTTQTAGNEFGFMAKKVSVTDVGSVEFGSIGDSPSESIGMIIDGAIGPWLEPVIAATSHCCNGPQTSELIEPVEGVANARSGA